MSIGSRFQTPPVVMDTNVLVAGACRHDGSPAYAVLLAVLNGCVPLMMTTAIALEYSDVLQRRRVLAITGLSHEQSADLVTDLMALSLEVQINFTWRPNLMDESDNKFIEAAIYASATIVTYNVRDFMVGDLLRYGWSVKTPLEFAARYL
jgi:predicted nucleic acid-binding protein